MWIEVFKSIQREPDGALITACPHAGAKEILLPKIFLNSIYWYKQVKSQVFCS